MKVIGERISILKKEDLLSVVILPTTDRKKLALLFLWLFAWTICGVIVLMNYFKLAEQQAKLFVIVYLSFWAYYEFKIGRTFIWKKWGKEKIWVQNGLLHYQKEVNGKGKIEEFHPDLINNLRLVETNEKSFADNFNESFWVKGAERIEFDCGEKNIRFGLQLTTEEARAILSELKKVLK